MSIKILVLSRNYPNQVLPYLGIWVERLVRYSSELCETRVISPVPYCPPLPKFMGSYTRFRRVPQRETSNGIEVWYPRFIIGPGYSLHNFEANTYYWGIRRQVEQIRQKFPFDLIHAHFGYPDGVVAARLSQDYQVPFIITEHSFWQPWMEDYPKVCRQAVWASNKASFHIAVSRPLRDSIAYFTKHSQRLQVIPVGMEPSVFTPLPEGHKPDPHQILFVGYIRFVKGVDILLKAMSYLVSRYPLLKLVIAGGSLYPNGQVQEDKLRHLVEELDLKNRVTFLGTQSPQNIAKLMQQSAMLVLPSRRETFGAVLVEALACGTPIVATRCGGPEDVVTNEVGVLVPKEDELALVNGIEKVLINRQYYDSNQLRNYAIKNFSWQQVAAQTVNLYYKALEQFYASSLVN